MFNPFKKLPCIVQEMELFPKPNSQTSLKQAFRPVFPEDAGDREETHRFSFAVAFAS